MKTFTLDEAQALLPIVEGLLNRAIEAKQAAVDLQEEMAALVRRVFVSGGMFLDIVAAQKRKVTLEALVQRAKDALEEIDPSACRSRIWIPGCSIFPACWKARRCCCAGSVARRASTSGIASRTDSREGSRLTRGFGGPRRKS